MDSQTNRHFFNIFFLILTFFSIQLFNANVHFSDNSFNEQTFSKQQKTSNINKSDLISFEQINYSDDLEVDTSFELQKRKIFDIDNIDIIHTSTIFTTLSKNEINITFNTYFNNNLYKLSNPRAPPLS